MRFKIRTFRQDPNNPEICSYSETYPDVEYDTNWFIFTNPSILNTDDYIPEWEDATDTDTIILFFLAEYAKLLIETNSHILCDEAIAALKEWCREDKTPLIEEQHDTREKFFRPEDEVPF